MLKKTVAALGAAAFATTAAALPTALVNAPDKTPAPRMMMKRACGSNTPTPFVARNPCNPCAVAKPCSPCNPCAPVAASGPCNPCAAVNPCSPCNPCAAQ